MCRLTCILLCCPIQLGLEIIDHRAWSPRGVHTTLVNEVYARANLHLEAGQDPKEALNAMIEEVRSGLEETINQPENSKVKVQRWYPGVVEEIVEHVDENRKNNVTQRLLNEASSILERKQNIQTSATKERTLEELLDEKAEDIEEGQTSNGEEKKEGPENAEGKKEAPANADSVSFAPNMPSNKEPGSEKKPKRRMRQKMRSTPVVGGGLFGEQVEARSGRESGSRVSHYQQNQGGRDMDWSMGAHSKGVPAEITVKGESYNIRISRETWRDLQKGFSGQMVDSRGIEIAAVNISASNADAPVTQRLQGYVRNMPLNQIQEESVDDSEGASMDASTNGAPQYHKNQ